jgi:hypothetical protein
MDAGIPLFLGCDFTLAYAWCFGPLVVVSPLL